MGLTARPPRVTFVVNYSRVRGHERLRTLCRAAALASGWEPFFAETGPGEAGGQAARAAVAAGAQLIVAAGGDGTVRACAQALAGTRVPLGIVPLGTANLAARALGLPTAAGPALAAVFSGGERRIDLAVADIGGGTTFAAMAGIGLDAEVVGATPALLKERLGWLAYALSGAVHLPGRRTRFTIRLDGGEPFTRLARSVVVGNAGLLPGGFTLLPQARLDDGLLDVGILAPASPAGWLAVAGLVVAGSAAADARLERHRARRAEIQAGAQLPRQADGEVVAPGRSLTVVVQPGALTVRVIRPG
jgi:undecaprenyl-diphosphatase